MSYTIQWTPTTFEHVRDPQAAVATRRYLVSKKFDAEMKIVHYRNGRTEVFYRFNDAKHIWLKGQMEFEAEFRKRFPDEAGSVL